MNLSELFIRRPVMTVALTVSVILFGVLAYFQLPVSDLPAIDYPVIQVQVSYPGATPETMANNVATPLERQFMQIPGLELVTFNNGQGHSSFVLQFALSKSLDGAATDVQAAITRAQGQLPVDLPSPPTFTKTNPNDQPIMYLVLASDSVTEGQLYDYANTQVGERISILPGVSQVAVYGTQSAVRVKADPSALAVRNITLEDLSNAIKNGTSYVGAGQFDGPHRTFLLQPQGQLMTAEQYDQLIVGQNNGAPVYLKDVATAKQGVQDERIDMRFWARGYQTEAEKIMKSNPAVRSTFTMSGNGQFLGSNQVFLIAFLKDPKQRPPIEQVSGQIMGQIMGTIPGAMAFLQPNPVLEISTGATANAQGQFAYAISGIDPNQVYDTAGKLVARMYQYPGFLFVNSDLYNHTPNLQVDILRDQAKLYGVSETRILALLHDAYSQNYSYLIKKATDQYQVILEVADDQRSDPTDLSKLYIKSDDGQRMVPLNAVTTWHPVIGPQSVNHINQFTSVTMFFNLKPGYAIGPATQFVEQTAKEILPPGIQGQLQGEALTFRNTVSDLAILMLVAVFVMYVILAILYESYLHPITVLSSLPVALLGGLLTLWLFGAEASLYAYIGMFMLMGIVKKNGIMIVDFAEQRVRQGIADDQAIHDASMERFRPIMMTTAAALLGASPDCAGIWCRWCLSTSAGISRRRRPYRFSVHNSVHHTGDLSVS